MPDDAFERNWAHFTLDGSPFRARYFVFGDVNKPVLVMTHGYATKSLSHFMLFKPLSTHFRIIFFDNCSWGGNTRLSSSSGLASPKHAREMMLSWIEAFFIAIDHLIPQKVLLYGASNGAYQLSLYASKYPERVAKLFLCSPVGFDGIQPTESYDIYAIRNQDKRPGPPSRAKVD